MVVLLIIKYFNFLMNDGIILFFVLSILSGCTVPNGCTSYRQATSYKQPAARVQVQCVVLFAFGGTISITFFHLLSSSRPVLALSHIILHHQHRHPSLDDPSSPLALVVPPSVYYLRTERRTINEVLKLCFRYILWDNDLNLMD
jgi:hypothetical protein